MIRIFIFAALAGAVWQLGEPGNDGPPQGYTWNQLNDIFKALAREAGMLGHY